MDSNLHCPIRIRRNDWVMNLNQISASYMEMFKHAQQEIIIMSSYFIPSNFFRINIIKCLKRGVRIRLILAGTSDVGISKYAERYLYSWAIRHGIEIHEYKNNILHGKVAVCDARMVTIGSYNVNDISALASIELNMDVEDSLFAETVHKTLSRIIDQECKRVNPVSTQTTYGPIERLMQWVAYETFRFVFFLFTFYFTRSKKNKKTHIML
jgi:cardiolipin synthase